MPHERLNFQNDDGLELSARFDHAVGPVRAIAVFAHCFTCTKNLRAIGHLSRALTERGISVLRFDFTGLGESEGEFADTNFSSTVDDLMAAARFLADRGQAPSILIGHSLGGAAALHAASRIDSVEAVATIGAPSSPRHLDHLLASSRAEIEREGVATVLLAGRPFKVKKQFLDDLESTSLDDSIRSLGAALLVVHSPVDSVVGIEHAAAIFDAARHPKSFVSLDTADHLLSNEHDSHYAGAVIGAWAGRYVDRVLGEPPVAGRVLTRTGSTGFHTAIRVGRHSLTADEPESVGGEDSGPSPYEYLSIGLGACTGMTLRMYADRKGWPLRSVEVSLEHTKIHASDCANCETVGGRIDRISRSITLEGPLDSEQRARLLEIADRCPVHRTLHSEVEVVTELAPR